MSSINATGYVAPSTLIQTNRTSQVNGAPDNDGEGDGGKRVHKGSRGGQMQQAMLQALQSLGLSMPQQAFATSASPTATGSADNDGDTDGSTAASGNVKNDMRQFMHTLFQAVKSESATTTTSSGATSGSTDQKANFSSGLAALISQASNGTAPTDLQNAFSQLMSDLQPSGASTASAGSSTAATTSSSQTSLQALLTQLQQNLGYGASSLTSTGNIVSALA